MPRLLRLRSLNLGQMGLHAKYTGIRGITHHSVAMGTGVWSYGDRGVEQGGGEVKGFGLLDSAGDAARGSLVLEEKK